MQKKERSFLVIPPHQIHAHQEPPGVLYFNIPIPELLQILLKQ